MEDILHQLVGNISNYVQGLYIPGDAGFLASTVSQYILQLKRVLVDSGPYSTSNLGKSNQRNQTPWRSTCGSPWALPKWSFLASHMKKIFVSQKEMCLTYNA